GPWRDTDALKKAHRRNVLREGEHWDWVGGKRAYYLDRLFPGYTCAIGGDRGENADATTEATRRLSRVLDLTRSRQAAPARARGTGEELRVDGRARYVGGVREGRQAPRRRRGAPRARRCPAAASSTDRLNI